MVSRAFGTGKTVLVVHMVAAAVFAMCLLSIQHQNKNYTTIKMLIKSVAMQ